MPEFTYEFTASEVMPEFLVGEVQSKLAYVDEDINKATVAPAGDRITLHLRQSPDKQRLAELEEKTQRVVLSMVKGAIQAQGAGSGGSPGPSGALQPGPAYRAGCPRGDLPGDTGHICPGTAGFTPD